MPRRTHPYDAAADREIARHPGARVVSRSITGSARVLVIEYRGAVRQVFHPATPSDSRTGPRNHVQDIRRVLRAIDEAKGPR